MNNKVEKLRALLNEATPGPWGTGYKCGVEHITVVDQEGKPAPRTGMRPAGDPYPLIARTAADYAPDQANAALICALRNAASDLLRVVEAARACYEADDFITEGREGDGRHERDQELGDALEALR